MRPSNQGMHEHDLDLIAALADGSTSDAADGAASGAGGARSLVETCPVCRAEYEAQTEVIAWLAGSPTPAMTDMERAGLHRAVRSGIESEKPAAPAAPWWQRLGYVAAGLLVVAGLVAVLQNSGVLGGADGLAESPATTVAGEAEAAGGAEGTGAPTEGIPFVAGDTAEDFDPQEAPTTTAAASESLTLPFAEFADEARSSQTQREETDTNEDDRECLARAGLDRHVVVREIEDEKTYLVVMPEDPAEDPVVFFVEVPECRIVFEDR